MALTQSAWTEKYVNGLYVAECNVIATTAESDAYTKKTPANLEPDKEWTLFFYSTIAADNTVPIDLWVGYSDNFLMSGDSTTVTATDGTNYKQIMDDAVAAIAGNPYVWIMDPNLAVADVVTAAAIGSGLKIKVPVAPYYAFNIDGATLVATTSYWKIVQKQDKKGI
jgi:hypothetical protein